MRWGCSRSIFCVTVARKRVDGFVATLSKAATHDGQVYQVTRPYNADTGRIRGAELSYQRFLDFLPGAWRGLGLQANATFVHSSTYDRTLRATAEVGCERQLWDRCINTSDRTKADVDMAQRFPIPFRREMVARGREIGLDPAYVYGLIRQESRFIVDARSGVGAAGLMQLMPATARWTAKKVGMPFTPDMITDRDVNLKLGTSYLKLVLDDLDGSQAMAAAAYNAGPNRPRRWREGPRLEPAIWVENVPFGETRDYVKKVLSNATFYAALLKDPNATVAPSLKARLGRSIGPREAGLPAPDTELP